MNALAKKPTWVSLVVSWFLVWIGLFVMGTAGFTLASSITQRVQGGFIFSLFGAGIVIAVYLLPVQLGVWGIGKLFKWNRSMIVWAFLAIGLLSPMVIIAPRAGFTAAVQRMEKTTGTKLPEGAKLVDWYHGVGFEDRRHLWLFEGTPKTFEKMFAHPDWSAVEDSEDLADLLRLTRSPAEAAVDNHLRVPIRETTMRIWFPEDRTLPPGPGYVLANPGQTRWAIWWDGI